MALQISLAEEVSGIGQDVPAAYVRIVLYTHDIKSDAVSFAVEFHINQQARNRNRGPIKGAAYLVNGVDLAGTGSIRNQLYTWLKTLPEFAGALDV